MTRRKKIISFAALVLALAVLAALVFALTPREPEYHGKKLSEWLEQTTNSSVKYSVGGDVREIIISTPANDAIRAMGTNTLLFLWRDLNAHDSPFIQRLNAFLNRQTLIPIYRPSAGVRLQRAANAMVILGPLAGPLAPEFIRWLPDTNRNQLAGQLLNTLGPAATTALARAAVADPNPYLRLQAALALGPGSKNYQLLCEVLATSLAPTQPVDLRRLALRHCVYPGSPSPDSAPNPLLSALLACLRDPDAEIRKDAAAMLADYRNVAIPYLEKIIADKSQSRAAITAAAQALQRIEADSAPRTP